ncbi:signal transduction histidine kinase [Haloactinospora alba]|uniref:histidine kinase n=1 Tax=Haloactinospora alba TaxID=405555 RepID=A0A543N7M4_9ACTN|nr:histidine kinase [Haloactinospora alba]TQN27829.1 signal transduction histidine kinase [Haloactinospora alba]
MGRTAWAAATAALVPGAATGAAPAGWRERLVGVLHLVTSLALSVLYLLPAALLVAVAAAVSLAGLHLAGAPGVLSGTALAPASDLPAGVLAGLAGGTAVSLTAAATLLARLCCWVQRRRLETVFGVVESGAPDPMAPGSRPARAVSYLYGRDAWSAVARGTAAGAYGALAGGVTVALVEYGAATAAGSLLAVGYAATDPSRAVVGALTPLGQAALGLAGMAAGVWLVPLLVRAEVGLSRRLLFDAPEVRMRRRLLHVEETRSRMVDAAEAERRRIERDLHDGAQQRLLAVTLTLTRARGRFGTDPDTAGELLEQARTEAKAAMAELREVTRGLHPRVLTDHGLGEALPVAAERCPVPVTLEVDLPQRPSPRVEGVVYYAVCEALANVAKHARAHSAAVRVERRDHRRGTVLRLTVTDDGSGGADPDSGTGLYGMRDRVNAVDGTLDVRSTPDEGTVLRADIPWEA